MDNRAVLGCDGEHSLVVLRNGARQYGSRRSESSLGNGLSLWRFSILGFVVVPVGRHGPAAGLRRCRRVARLE